MSVVPLGTQVVYKSSPAVSVPGDKPEITPAVLPTFVQCSSSPIKCNNRKYLYSFNYSRFKNLSDNVSIKQNP
jgi:hypothetical protein